MVSFFYFAGNEPKSVPAGALAAAVITCSAAVGGKPVCICETNKCICAKYTKYRAISLKNGTSLKKCTVTVLKFKMLLE